MRRLLLMVLVLLLGALTAWQWYDWPPEPASVAVADITARDVTYGSVDEILAELPVPDEPGQFASIIERPLFRPDRRPKPPTDGVEQAETEAPTELARLDLTGIMITPEGASAWVREDSAPQARRLRIGDEIGGWALVEILPDRIRLERQGEVDALLLRDYRPSVPMAAPNTAPGSTPRRPPRMPTRVDPSER